MAMTEKKRQAAKFFERLLKANLSSSEESWDDILTEWDQLVETKESRLTERLRQSDVERIRACLEAEAKGQKILPWFEAEVGAELTEPPLLPILRETQQVADETIRGLLLNERAPLRVRSNILFRFDFNHPLSLPIKPKGIVEISPKSDVVWRFLIPLLRQWPFPFGMCPVCDHVFAQAGRGKPRQYCSDRCKAKGIPSYARRSAYQSERRQRRRDEKWQLARDAIREGQSEQEQIESLSKALPELKSRRACVQLLNKVRLKQRRTKRTKGKED
jgi:hypothetical protein